MLGLEVLLPLDPVIGHAELCGDSTTEYAIKLSERMDRIHQFARQYLKLSSDRLKKNYDHRPVNQHQYNRGDAVWLYSPQKKKGICPNLMRQFLVMKSLRDVIYRIQKGPKTKPKVVHHDRLRPYQGPNVPDWLTEGSAPKEPEQPAVPKSPVVASSPAPTLPKSVARESRDPRRSSPGTVPAVRAVRTPMRMHDYLLE